MPRLTIKRGGGYSDMLRSYKIEIDGQIVGSIRRHETHTFDVSEGMHKVRMRIDWCGSQVVDVLVGPQGADLICSPNRYLPWFAIVFLFMPGRWVWLRPARSPAGAG